MNAVQEDLVSAFYRALATADLQLFLSIQTDDVVYNISGHSPISGQVVGKRALVESILPQVFPGLQMDTFRFSKKWRVMCADERRVVSFMEADGLGINGKRYDQRYVQVFEFRDGKISAVWEFFDTALADAVLFYDPSKSVTAGKLPPFDF
jgi:ketosteroid isomerase-like protein